MIVKAGDRDQRRQAGLRTRGRLTDAALDLLAERGEEGVTLREVTAAAGWLLYAERLDIFTGLGAALILAGNLLNLKAPQQAPVEPAAETPPADLSGRLRRRVSVLEHGAQAASAWRRAAKAENRCRVRARPGAGRGHRPSVSYHQAARNGRGGS